MLKLDEHTATVHSLNLRRELHGDEGGETAADIDLSVTVSADIVATIFREPEGATAWLEDYHALGGEVGKLKLRGEYKDYRARINGVLEVCKLKKLAVEPAHGAGFKLSYQVQLPSPVNEDQLIFLSECLAAGEMKIELAGTMTQDIEEQGGDTEETPVADRGGPTHAV
jgi:hypothetical protein